MWFTEDFYLMSWCRSSEQKRIFHWYFTKLIKRGVKCLRKSGFELHPYLHIGSPLHEVIDLLPEKYSTFFQLTHLNMMCKAQVWWWGLLETSHLFWNLFLLGVLLNHLKECLGAIKYLKSNVWQISEQRMQVAVPWCFHKLFIQVLVTSANKEKRRAANRDCVTQAACRGIKYSPLHELLGCPHPVSSANLCVEEGALSGSLLSFVLVEPAMVTLYIWVLHFRVLWNGAVVYCWGFCDSGALISFLPNQDDTWCKRELCLLQHFDLEWSWASERR